MTAGEIIEACGPLMHQLSRRAAIAFGDEADDWFSDLALEIVTFATKYDPARGALTTWVALRWRRLVGLRKLPYLKRNRRLPTLDLSDPANLTTDSRSPDPAAVAELRERADAVRAEVARLDDRERLLISMRFGFTDDGPQGRRAEAEAMGVCAARCDQIARAAVRELATVLGGDPAGVAASPRRRRRTVRCG